MTAPERIDVVWDFDTALEGSFNEARDTEPDESPPISRPRDVGEPE